MSAAKPRDSLHALACASTRARMLAVTQRARQRTLRAGGRGARHNRFLCEPEVLRLNSALIVQLSAILTVSADEILGLERPAHTTAAITNRRLYRQLQSIDKLPKRDQQALLRTIDAFLSKAS